MSPVSLLLVCDLISYHKLPVTLYFLTVSSVIRLFFRFCPLTVTLICEYMSNIHFYP